MLVLSSKNYDQQEKFKMLKYIDAEKMHRLLMSKNNILNLGGNRNT